MGTFLMIIGFGWAAIGFGNIVLTPLDNIFYTAGMIFNFVAFVLPGLMVGGIGYVAQLAKKRS